MSNTLENAMIPWGPVWDASQDLKQLLELARCLAYLTSPQHLKKDDDFEIFHAPLMDIMIRLDAACEEIDKAMKDVKFNDQAKA